MAYTIRNADGTVLLNLVDGTVDKSTTSLTLIGKNTDAYGTALNNNLVNMLQNFASVSQPRSPLVGQLWYDVSAGRLKVFSLDGTFGELASALLSDTQPALLKQGDLWIDTANDQLYFTKNGLDAVLAGPIYSSRVGKSGWAVETLKDTGNVSHTVIALYATNQLMGVLSTSSFEILEAGRPRGMQYITAGITLNPAIPNIKFAGTTTNADAIIGITPANYLLNDNQGQNQYVNGTGALYIRSDSGLKIGLYDDLELFTGGAVGSRSSAIRNTIVDAKTRLITIKSYPSSPDAQLPTLTAQRGNVAIGTDTVPDDYKLYVGGPTYINGNLEVFSNLYVYGTLTNVVSQNVQIVDKNIELNYGSSSDGSADGGGITVSGATPKKFYFVNTLSAWSSNIDLNLEYGKSLRYNGQVLLTTDTLGPTITKSSLQTLGVLTQLTVTNVIIKGSGIAASTSTVGVQLISASGVNVGSTITVTLSSFVPILNSGTTVQILGIGEPAYNNTYNIQTVIQTGTSFTVRAVSTLTSTSPPLGANPVAVFKDLMLTTTDSPSNAGIDVTGRRIKNLQYSNVPTDAATVQFAIDAGSIQSLKGFIVTLDVTSMVNVNQEIIAILNNLAPPANTLPGDGLYQNDYQYDLPVGYRARVLCQTNTIPVPPVPINVAAATAPVMAYPDGTQVSAITNVAASAVGTITTATFTYTIKEFRVIAGPPPQWWFYRNIS